ncbi:peptidase ma family protein [Diplodia corticola]|uniref:Peptidase ma family protein n=1 Tax=Diplodia corticola TaxID=236234 RepID=A0A1J9RHX7_9PEZI|nr:peptidase ma family protein [Diplodia corticola]OJD40240.1 peptidase ma family protein [Diplodia corticola]
MHNFFTTTGAVFALSAAIAAAAPTTVAADGKTFSIWADYSRCDRADALSLQILDFDAPSSEADPKATRQPTGEDLVQLTAPFSGSVTLLEVANMGPYRQQSVSIELYAAPSGDAAVYGNATFEPGSEVRSWSLVKWGAAKEGEALWPSEGEEAASQPVMGKAGSVVTSVSGDSLFLEWCTR